MQIDEGGANFAEGSVRTSSRNSLDYVGGRSRNDAMFVELALV